ncbi:cardiolipin synthase [Zobellia sp. 1_MG-2023]|uniref:cardiolipin synthase n=1 Tax=Zobellia sp. 1_MG-2023 TaxID=3062626 RepID=UPI0026E405CD|nr:cardiolipin synthase [Zobellia sp. 1_MG-2023]MDO6819823.1 cardiolipin synthase [Zobellia sp. 1_MG-2023]
MTIALIIYFSLALFLVGRLLLYGIRPTKTLAWLLAIFTISVGGMLFYFVLGRNRRKNKFYRLKKTEEISAYLKKVEAYCDDIDRNNGENVPEPIKGHLKLVKLIAKNSNFLPSFGNELTSLKNGQATFDAIFQAMEGAQKFIHVQYYIFEQGELGDRFLALWQRKIKEGVEIRFLYDGLGSNTLSKAYVNQLKEAGVEVFSFLPIRFKRLLSSINYRNHRKIVVVDGHTAFTGGINVSDKYINGDPILGTWHDMHLRLRGPVVNSLQAVFAMDWSFASGKDDMLTLSYFSTIPKIGKSVVQTVSSGPDSDFPSVHQLYFSLINGAKKYVYIVNPYIIPGEALMEALQVAALGGVDVRILLSSNSDSFLVRWSVRSYFENFLEAGVRIYLYPDGFLHSKIMFTDDELTTIGTANLDVRSFEQNYEVNVLAYDKELTRELKRDFLNDCKISHEINYKEFTQRPKSERFKEGLAKIFSPVL